MRESHLIRVVVLGARNSTAASEMGRERERVSQTGKMNQSIDMAPVYREVLTKCSYVKVYEQSLAWRKSKRVLIIIGLTTII